MEPQDIYYNKAEYVETVIIKGTDISKACDINKTFIFIIRKKYYNITTSVVKR